MPTYTWNFPSGGSIVYKKDKNGFLEIKYNDQSRRLNSDTIYYNIDNKYFYTDNDDNDDYVIEIVEYEDRDDETHYKLRYGTMDKYEENINTLGEFQVTDEDIPEDLGQTLFELGESIFENNEPLDLPEGFIQSGGRRRKARKTRKARKSRKSRKARKSIRRRRA